MRQELGKISATICKDKEKRILSFAIYPEKFAQLAQKRCTQNASTQTELDELSNQLVELGITTSNTKDSSTQTDDSLVIPNMPSSVGRSLPNWLKDNNSSPKRSQTQPNNTSNNKKAKIEPKPVPFVFNDKAVMNLTNVEIPKDVSLLLSFGPKFIPPVLTLDKPQIFSDISKLQNCSKSFVPKNAYEELLKMVQNCRDAEPSWRQTQIINLVNLASAFFKEHPEIVVDNSDKGNITVIMTQDQYKQRVWDKITNNEAYSPLLISQHEKLMKKNYTLLLRSAEESFVPHKSIFDIVANETKFSQVYGQIKTHKPDDNYPARLINANIGVVGNKLSNVILPILNRMNSNDPFRILNSNDLCHKLKLLKLQKDDMLFSLDIVDMFTNIPVNFAWEHIKTLDPSKFTNMSLNLFESIFKFITLEATEFKFEEKLFQMNKGLPMGVATSPVIACLVTTKLLIDALSLVKPVTFITKYVDDILLITNKENADRFLTILNQHASLKYKLEMEENATLNYLDVTIFRKEDGLITKWYHKPYASHRLVNWFSYHDKTITTNTAINYVKNMLNLTSPIFKEDIEYAAFNILKLNSFPETVIQSIISNIQKTRYAVNEQTPTYIGVHAPLNLMASINTSIKNKIQGQNIRFVNKSFSNNLGNKIYSTLKSKEDFMYQNYMILKLSCKNCKYCCISPIIYPIILFTVFDLDHTKHPFYDIQRHIAASKHSNDFQKETIRICENKEETLRLAEIEGMSKKLNFHKLASKSNPEIVRKFFSKK